MKNLDLRAQSGGPFARPPWLGQMNSLFDTIGKTVQKALQPILGTPSGSRKHYHRAVPGSWGVTVWVWLLAAVFIQHSLQAGVLGGGQSVLCLGDGFRQCQLTVFEKRDVVGIPNRFQPCSLDGNYAEKLVPVFGDAVGTISTGSPEMGTPARQTPSHEWNQYLDALQPVIYVLGILCGWWLYDVVRHRGLMRLRPNAEVSDRRPPAANPETNANRGGGSLD